VDLKRDRDDREQRGEEERATCARLRPCRASRPAARGERDEARSRHPEGVEQSPFDVGGGDALVEVGAVGDAADDQAAGDQQPVAPTRGDPDDRDRAHDEGQKRDVPDGIGEVDHRLRGVERADGVEHRLHQGGPEGRGGEGSDRAVEPHARAEALDAGADEEHDSHVQRRVAGEVEVVGRGGVLVGGGSGAPVDIARGPQPYAEAERHPRPPLLSHERRAEEADERGTGEDRVVDVVVEEVVGRRSSDAGARVQGVQRDPRPEDSKQDE
jgi:hypothetical protein